MLSNQLASQQTEFTKIETGITSINDTNINSINQIVNQRASDIADIFNSTSRSIYIDSNTLKSIERINNKLETLSIDTETLRGNKDSQLSALRSQLGGPNPPADLAGTINTIQSQISGLQNIQTRLIGTTIRPTTTPTPSIGSRIAEYSAIQTHANHFNLANTIGDQDIDITTSPRTTANIDLQTTFLNTSTTPDEYSICDSNGNPLSTPTLNRTVSPPVWTVPDFNITQNGTQYTISGITFNGTNLDITNIDINPKVGLPIELNLSITATYTNVLSTGINVSHNKPLKLIIRNTPISTTLDQTARTTQIQAYNTAGTGNNIRDRLTNEHSSNIRTMTRDAFYRALEHADGPKFNQLNDQQKERLFLNIFPDGQAPNGLQIIPGTIVNRQTDINNINTFQSTTIPTNFLQRASNDARDFNRGENIASEANYTAYIHNNIETLITRYINESLDNLFINTADSNLFLKTRLTQFLTTIQSATEDNNTFNNVIPLFETNRTRRVKGQQKNAQAENERQGLNPFTRADTNYLRFFAGKQSREISGSVNINTDEHNMRNPDRKYSSPINYNLNTNVTSSNSVRCSISINGEAPFILRGRDPHSIVRGILRNTTIPFGKLRMHIAYNFLKSMVSMAQDNHLPLTYLSDARLNQAEKITIRLVNDKIILDEVTDDTTTNRRNISTIFSESQFDNSNERDDPANHRSLRRGIEQLSDHFNLAMNQVHREYRQASERQRHRLLIGGSEMKSPLPQSIIRNPIKSMKTRFGQKMNFPFSTSLTSNGNNISIDFDGKYFTVTMGEHTFQNKDLGAILNKKSGRKRIFDGMERDICASVYENMITELRGNTNIASKHFAVRDSITGGAYVLDPDGERSFIEPEHVDQLKLGNKQRGILKLGVVGALLGAAAPGVGQGLMAVGSSLWSGGLSAAPNMISSGASTARGAITNPGATASAARSGIKSGFGLGGAVAGGAIGSTKPANVSNIRNRRRPLPFGYRQGTVGSSYSPTSPTIPTRVLNNSETQGLYRNPLLMARTIKAMANQL